MILIYRFQVFNFYRNVSLQKYGSFPSSDSEGTREEEVGEEGRSNRYTQDILISTEFGVFYG